MTSALSITRAVNPPRAVFLDFPLGHTTGKPGEPELQRQILLGALAAFTELEKPGEVKRLPYRWSVDDSWKDSVMRGGDSRVERSEQPQYQLASDRERVDNSCPSCVFLES